MADRRSSGHDVPGDRHILGVPDLENSTRKTPTTGPANAEDVLDELNSLCHTAELTSYPLFVWNPLKVDLPSAFGRRGNYYVSLSGGFVARYFYTDRAAFRAIVLHELAHIRNGDVSKTYFTMAVSVAFVIAAVLPELGFLCWFGFREEDLPIAFFDIALSMTLVLLTGFGLLRVREYYADVRASVWDRTSANLSLVLNALSASKPSLWRRPFRFHPDSLARQRILGDTYMLFRPNVWNAFGMGVALSIAINTGQTIALQVLASGLFRPPQSLFLFEVVGQALVPLALVSIAIAAEGTAVWRGTIAGLIRNERMYDSGRVGLALALGFGLISARVALEFLTSSFFRSTSLAPQLGTILCSTVLILFSFTLVLIRVPASRSNAASRRL